MIRSFIPSELDTVMQIWLESNISAHPFIVSGYWQSHFETVKDLLPQAEIFIYEEAGIIKGFIGIQNKSYIAGLFVGSAFQGCGIGRELMSAAKERFSRLELSVYTRNEKAVKFYLKQDFQIIKEQTDSDTGQPEYVMACSSAAKSKLK